MSDLSSCELEECLDKIRKACAASVRAASPSPRIALGVRSSAARAALPPTPTEARRARFLQAQAFLKARCVLVSPCDREALVRRYWVSGKREPMFAEEVIAHAERLGFEVTP